jgi:glycerol uptake facilitator protein
MCGMGATIAIYCTAGVSGAHINHAITIELATFNGFDKRKVLPYIISRLLGAFCSVALIYALYSNFFTDLELAHGFLRNSEMAFSTATIFSAYPYPSLSIRDDFSVEFAITAILMIAILTLGDIKNGKARGSMNPILLGIIITVIGGSLGQLTAFSMNPARDFGPKIFAYFAGWEFALSGEKETLCFIVTILGACFAGWAYLKLIEKYLSNADNGCTTPNQFD